MKNYYQIMLKRLFVFISNYFQINSIVYLIITIDFNNQLKIADVLLKVYQYRHDKFKTKINNISDIFSSNYENYKEFFQKTEKLELMDAKLSQVEVKLNLMNNKLNKLISIVDEKCSDYENHIENKFSE